MSLTKYPIDAGLVTAFCGHAPKNCRTNQIVLPTTEATADANTFVCEFLGGASANETGVGGGLTGADLVFTQVGSVPAASGGCRQLTAASSQYFTCTTTFQTTFFNASEWTVIWDAKDWSSVGWLCALRCGTTNQGQLIIQKPVANLYFSTSNVGDSTVAVQNALHLGTPATNVAFKVAVWRKNGLVHAGYKESSDYPTGWDWFPRTQRCAMPANQFTGDWNAAGYLSIVGSSGGAGYSPTLKIGKVICSKVGLPSAPV